MPEAPEVENVIRQLSSELTGLSIQKASIRYEKLVENMDPARFEKSLKGQHFLEFSRHGKYLVFNLDQYQWISHLRMEGSYFLRSPETFTEDKHIHAVFELSDGRILCYRDTRKFGRMNLLQHEELKSTDRHPVLGKLGLDVMDPRWDGEYLFSLLSRRKAAIKTVLLDQKVIAGIGNIYANEILFAAGIHPARPASELSLADCEKIVSHMQEIIARAIELKGTTIRTFSYDGNHTGSFQDFLKVHEQEICPVCGSRIERKVINQRSAYLCPHCQK